MKKSVLCACLFFVFSISSYAKFYAVFDGIARAEGCNLYHVSVYDDAGTSNPQDDLLVSSGWITDCTLNIQGGNQPDMSPNQEIKSLKSTSGIIPYDQIETSQELTEKGNLKVYPNPTSENLTVKINNFKPTTGFISSLNGVILKQFNESELDGASLQISISELTSGTYLILLSDGQHYRKAKFVVD